jgi:hypothetical protein
MSATPSTLITRTLLMHASPKKALPAVGFFVFSEAHFASFLRGFFVGLRLKVWYQRMGLAGSFKL